MTPTRMSPRSALLLLSLLPLAACAGGKAEPLRLAGAMTPTEQYGIVGGLLVGSGNPLLAALGGTWGENLGYYGMIITRDLRARRAQGGPLTSRRRAAAPSAISRSNSAARNCSTAS